MKCSISDLCLNLPNKKIQTSIAEGNAISCSHGRPVMVALRVERTVHPLPTAWRK